MQSLTSTLERSLSESDSHDKESVRSDRIRNHRYYSGVLDTGTYGKKKSGSQHVSWDVFDSVESKKAYYLEAIGTARRSVSFMPENEGDAERARLRTSYVEYAIYEIQNGWEIISDLLHDAFVAKRCVLRHEWVVDVRERRVSTEDLDQAQAVAVLQIAEQNGGGIDPMTGEIVWQEDRSRHESVAVQPELFRRDPNAARISEAQYTHEVWEITRGEALSRGWDAADVAEMQHDSSWTTGEADAGRNAFLNGGTRGKRGNTTIASQDLVTAYLSHVYMTSAEMQSLLEGRVLSDQEAIEGASQDDYQLYRIWWSKGVILEAELARDGLPYMEWCEFKISHSEHGLCEADVQSSLMRTRSVLQRLMVDNAAMTNTSRWEANPRMIENPRELLENNIGGIVWSKQPGNAIRALPQPQLNPASMSVLEVLEREKENRSGLSRLAKGLNADAVTKQNADSMIERLTNASNRRVMRGVRDFCQTFLVPWYQRVLALGVRYDRYPISVEVSGQFVQVTPAQLGVSQRCKIKVALTPDEAAADAQMLLTMHGVQSQDPQMGLMYGPQQRHALMDDIYERMGVEDSSAYLMRPDSPEYQQAMAQQAQMQQQMQVMQQQVSQMQAMLAQSADQRAWYEAQNQAAARQIDSGVKVAGQELDEREFEHKQDVDVAEIEIERTQRRAANVG